MALFGKKKKKKKKKKTSFLKQLLLKNPTKKWERQPHRTPLFDFSSITLTGVGINDDLEKLSFLGSVKKYKPCLIFPEDGLRVYFDEEWVTGFDLVMQPEKGFKRPFTGEIRFKGMRIQLNARSSRENIEHIFGEPDRVVETKKVDKLDYLIDGTKCEFVMTKDDKIKEVIIGH